MLRVLGEVSADGVGPIRSRAQRVILAGLALEQDHQATADRLADLVWPADAPANATASLQSHISRLRRALPDDVGIEATGSGYVLKAELDVTHFDEALSAAETEPTPERLGTIDTALGLWRGQPFTELDDPQAASECVRLTGVREALLELRSESLLVAGRTGEAIAALEAQRERSPLRERPVELLMRAFVETGRTADALAAYAGLRETLVEELGIDPSPDLRELESAILTEDALVTPRHPIDRVTPDGHSSPVAVPVSPFFGREAEMRELAELFGHRRIVTLLGPGGIGKTRLALHTAAAVGSAFADGVTVVELAEITDADVVAEAIASRLGVPPRSGLTPEERIVDALGPQNRLLLLDNCEHLIDATAGLVDRLARSAPDLVVLATSREPLNIDGEQAFHLEPLSPTGGGIDLFVDRAMAARPGFRLDDSNRPQIEQLCLDLDGLPLALELAAAKMATTTLESITEGLDERLALLDRGRRTADHRHRSLRSVIDWSARDLHGPPRAVFMAASVFASPFSIDDAAIACNMPVDDVRSALEVLAERSLLRVVGPEGAESRFAYLATIRAYANELLRETPEWPLAVDRHAQWASDLATDMRSSLGGPQERAAVARVMDALPDLRIAHRNFLKSGRAEQGLVMGAALYQLAVFVMVAELFDWMTETAEAFADQPGPEAEEVLAGASVGAWRAGDLDLAASYAERARAAADHDAPGAGRASTDAHADVLGFTGELDASGQEYDRALELARASSDPVRIVFNLANSAMMAGYTGRTDWAADAAAEARALLSTDGTSLLDAWLDYAEGESLAEVDPERAISLLGRAVERAHAASSSFIANVAGLSRAGLQIRTGDPRGARDGLAQALEDWWHVGARVQQWIALRTVVEGLVSIEDLEGAGLVLGAVERSAGAVEISGPDRARLDAARASIEAERADAAELFEAGAALAEDELVAMVLERLRSEG